ncbi:MAG TPA: hypothetical protein ENK57_22525 [Polyangiaceae bacterium]|nr:hypothetical protein [Polyangiaceae bacterium]
MLEIIIVRWLYGWLASSAKKKGRPGSWGMLGVGLWFGGEVGGLVVGVMLTGEAGAMTYLSALVTAVIGAVVAVIVVMNLDDRSEQPPLEF